jgi:hypothetical protein
MCHCIKGMPSAKGSQGKSIVQKAKAKAKAKENPKSQILNQKRNPFRNSFLVYDTFLIKQNDLSVVYSFTKLILEGDILMSDHHFLSAFTSGIDDCQYVHPFPESGCIDNLNLSLLNIIQFTGIKCPAR